ncbi:MAG: malate dehydrogenase [Thermodesulfovibrionales bacterium]
MKKKVSVIGAGNVGASLAQLLVHSGLADVVLFDIVEGVPQGKALDLSEACPLWGSSVKVTGTNDFKDTADSDVIVITAGFPRKPGMSRDDLLSANAKVVADVARNTCGISKNAIYIVVTNPMDVMAQMTLKVTGFNPNRIIGMGGILDSARFRTFVAWELGIAPEDVEALVMGGHGDQMVPMPRFTTAKGISITHLIDEDRINKLIERTKNGGAEIVGLLKTGSAFYAPAASTFQMVKSVILDEKRLLPCSAYLDGQYGLKGYYAGVPVILGENGVEKIVEIPLNEKERQDLERSFNSVKNLVQKLDSAEVK